MIYVASYHRGIKHVWAGTMDEMCNEIFGYSLECGNSWNSKIPRYPKSVKTLVKALNDSAYECRRYQDSYSESNEAEYNQFKNGN